MVHIRVTLLLVWLEVSLSISGHSQASPSQLSSSSELVIPLKVTARGKGAKASGQLSYSLRFGGQRHIVHMRVKKFLISRHLPMFTYTDQRALHQDQPFVPDDCYYHGYVEGVPESLVALSTCSGGFRGMLLINDLAYEIEPVRFSVTFEHWVYMIDADETHFPSMRCGLTEEEITRQLELQESYNSTLMQSSYVGWWTHWRFIELLIFVDHFRFLHCNGNVSVVQQEVSDVVNIVDILYYPLEVYVTLAGIEIWNQGNPFHTDNIHELLENFAMWKYLNIGNQLSHEASHLFIKKSYGINHGVAYVGSICQYPYNSGVEVFEDKSLALFALTVSHELGHNLGMLHDDKWCVCELEFCVMYSFRKVTVKFSNCSYAQYWDNTMRRGLCILSPSRFKNTLKVQYCGNRIVDEGEECDCGDIHQCVKDPCCLFNCTLKPGAACSSGICCKDCEFLPPGTLCRQQVNECDLPEWCNGTSHQCPEDVYVQDGIPCSDSAYCYKVSCSGHDIQCREIFGKEARKAPQSCYKEINTQGNRFGHCGIVDRTYTKCEDPDILCGRIQCENVGVIPNLIEHSTVHQYHFNNTTCWGTDYHLGISIPDVGQVRDGTACGPEKICIHHRCVRKVQWPQDCQSKTCHMKGVCNNKQNCHCNHGWAPPFCNTKGYGGSYNSGPPPKYHEQRFRRERVLGLLSILWLIPLILLVSFCCSVICKTPKRKKVEDMKQGIWEEVREEKRDEEEEEEEGED